MVILIVCFLNFVACGIGSLVVGGSAASGFKEDGRYFLVEHGKKTEVSMQIWNYSLWHYRSLFVTHPLAMIMLVILGGKWDENRKKEAVR